MTDGTPSGLVGRTVSDLAGLVRGREVSPVEVVQAHLDQIERLDGDIGAFEVVRDTDAIAEAEKLAGREDLADFPLAGVPIPIKDNLPVAGRSPRIGSLATPADALEDDHEIVDRLTAAGAIVIGITRMPEIGLWGTSDSATGVARNPWNQDHTPGGSSGGSAAAVATAMAPGAQGTDGLGSIRIPAACCGLVGMKPGSGIVPAHYCRGKYDWFGMVENGPLATTVEDAALLLSIMAGRENLRAARPQEEPLRIAVSTKVALPGVRADAEWAGAAMTTARLLADAGHTVVEADPPAPIGDALAIVARWFVAAADEVEGLDPSLLQGRTRMHARIGQILDRLGVVRPSQRDHLRRLCEQFFADHDVLLTPSLANYPIAADYRDRPWLANVNDNSRYAPFAAPWNMTGYPAVVVPAGMGLRGMPLSVQLVASDGGESRILSLAALIEQTAPWPRHAPIAGVSNEQPTAA